ncbi:hypothetical protein BHE74_00029544 [Ensete ventricosum]|nr:hypothetical protein BHE74_00029544 [Ensete ventricosum]
MKCGSTGLFQASSSAGFQFTSQDGSQQGGVPDHYLKKRLVGSRATLLLGGVRRQVTTNVTRRQAITYSASAVSRRQGLLFIRQARLPTSYFNSASVPAKVRQGLHLYGKRG